MYTYIYIYVCTYASYRTSTHSLTALPATARRVWEAVGKLQGARAAKSLDLTYEPPAQSADPEGRNRESLNPKH